MYLHIHSKLLKLYLMEVQLCIFNFMSFYILYSEKVLILKETYFLLELQTHMDFPTKIKYAV